MNYFSWKEQFLPVSNQGCLVSDFIPQVEKDKVWYCYLHKYKTGLITLTIESEKRVKNASNQYRISKEAGFIETTVSHNYKKTIVDFYEN